MSPYNYTFKRTFCCSTVIQLTNNANFSKYVLTFVPQDMCSLRLKLSHLKPMKPHLLKLNSFHSSF